MDIGLKIDSLYAMRATRLDLEATVKEMKSAEALMRSEIVEALQDSSLQGAKGATATASLKYTTAPHVEDWDAVYSYIMTTGRFALLHRRISSQLWEAIKNEEGDIPGISAVALTDLSLTKSTRS